MVCASYATLHNLTFDQIRLLEVKLQLQKRQVAIDIYTSIACILQELQLRLLTGDAKITYSGQLGIGVGTNDG